MATQNSMNYQHKNIDSKDNTNNSRPSTLFVACFSGDIETVRKILKNTSFENINRLEPNGSTTLHTAVECNHTEIVRLLLHDHGVIRHLVDKDGHTAFDLAQTDEMRQLFYRPASNENRFYGNEAPCTVFTANKDDKIPSSKRVKPYKTIEEVRQREYMKAFYDFHSQARIRIPQVILNWWTKGKSQEPIDHLLSLINEHIGSTNAQYAKAVELVRTFSKTKNSDPLIRLFTLETPFYRFLNEREESTMAFYTLFGKSDKSCFTGRQYEGICYRGLSMTYEDLRMYEWAREEQHRYIEVNTFCSSTRDKERARFHAEANENNERRRVLMIFEFEETCCTAIRLDKVSDTLPSLSDFPEEEEVLILPGTTFSIQKIVRLESLTTIYLTHLNMDDERWKYLNMVMDNASEVF